VAAQARIANEKNLVLFKNKEFFIIMNKFPYNPYHLMVIPNQHLGDLDELDNHVWLNINFAAKKCIAILKKEIKSPGFNIGMNLGAAAGAGIAEHLHLHIIPRWFGDTNFMPLIAETKAIPTHNLAVYRRLKPLFKNFSL
jgi:ATP adenylyltransferase